VVDTQEIRPSGCWHRYQLQLAVPEYTLHCVSHGLCLMICGEKMKCDSDVARGPWSIKPDVMLRGGTAPLLWGILLTYGLIIAAAGVDHTVMKH